VRVGVDVWTVASPPAVIPQQRSSFSSDKTKLVDPTNGSEWDWLAKVADHRARDRQKYLLRRCFYDSSDGGALADPAKSIGSDHALRSAVAVSAFRTSRVFVREDFSSTLSVTHNIGIDIVAASLRKENMRRAWFHARTEGIVGLTAGVNKLIGVVLPRRNEEEQPADVKTEIPYRLVDDESIMRLVQAGDPEAMGALYERYSRLVRVTGLRILRDESEAQELVQDVFLYLYQKNRLFDRHKSTLRSWLVQVAYSRAFDRRDYLLARRFYDYVQIEELVESVGSTLSLDRHVENVRLRGILQGVFSELSERQRLTLSMFFVEGYSLREISSHLDETLVNTRHYYYRGLETLRTALKGRL